MQRGANDARQTVGTHAAFLAKSRCPHQPIVRRQLPNRIARKTVARVTQGFVRESSEQVLNVLLMLLRVEPEPPYKRRACLIQRLVECPAHLRRLERFVTVFDPIKPTQVADGSMGAVVGEQLAGFVRSEVGHRLHTHDIRERSHHGVGIHGQPFVSFNANRQGVFRIRRLDRDHAAHDRLDKPGPRQAGITNVGRQLTCDELPQDLSGFVEVFTHQNVQRRRPHTQALGQPCGEVGCDELQRTGSYCCACDRTRGDN